MDVTFRRVALAETDSLATFLAGETWPFHSNTRIDEDAVRRLAADGHFDSDGVRTFLIELAGAVTGMLRVFDLDDGTPLFDLRIGAAHRGRGIGTRAVGWLTDHVFTEFPDIDRIEATTRQDNHRMRAALRRCGYAKEAHHRKAWPAETGPPHDAVGYAILREDWSTGTVTPPNFDDEPH